jgi:hypothetical protein
MTVGDAVGDVSANNTAMTFQPAISVTVMITSLNTDGTGNSYANVTDGANNSAFNNNDDLSVCKVIITNSNYITFSNLGVGSVSAYTGIQIK